jgi:hypothetical protein
MIMEEPNDFGYIFKFRDTFILLKDGKKILWPNHSLLTLRPSPLVRGVVKPGIYSNYSFACSIDEAPMVKLSMFQQNFLVRWPFVSCTNLQKFN